jgi:hypothetical protein
MAKNTIDRRAQEAARKAGKKGETGSGDTPVEGAGQATTQQVSGDTDGGAKQDEKNRSGKGGKKGAGKGKKKKKKARKVLRKAVKKEVKDTSTLIAKAIVQQAINGDKHSADMMLSFIEKKKKDDATSSRHGGLTAADLLGSEDEWESESFDAEEGKSEVGMGGREPEGRGDSE